MADSIDRLLRALAAAMNRRREEAPVFRVNTDDEALEEVAQSSPLSANPSLATDPKLLIGRFFEMDARRIEFGAEGNLRIQLLELDPEAGQARFAIKGIKKWLPDEWLGEGTIRLLPVRRLVTPRPKAEHFQPTISDNFETTGTTGDFDYR